MTCTLLGLTAAVIDIVMVLLVPPLLDGVRRKIYAAIQRRIGPPILQTWYDLAKLYHRRASAAETGNPFYLAAPASSLAYALIAALMLALPCLDSSLAGIIGFTVLLAGSTAVVVIGSAGLTPLTSAGSIRLLALSSIAEAGVLLALLAVSPTLFLHDMQAPMLAAAAAAIALTLAAIVEFELAPYNVVEAGPEIAAGPYTEYGGAELALLMQASWCRGFALLLAAGLAAFHSWLAAPLYAIIAYLVIAAVTASIGRPRPLRAMGLAFACLVIGAVALLLTA